MALTRELVILSGKGGTGKTSVTAAFAHLLAGSPVRAVLADTDVDAANLELLLHSRELERHAFTGGSTAIIDEELCEPCGTCAAVCRFDAIEDGAPPVIDPFACEGCAACFYQCPTKAIRMEEETAGHWFRSESRYGPLFHATMRAGQENSGKLVALVKRQAKALAEVEGYDLVLVDGPPGIGCPVISAVSGADLALVVAEPGVAGVHDMERALETLAHFRVPAVVAVNKADLNPQGAAKIETDCRERGLELLGRIPYDTVFTEAMVEGVPVTAYRDGPASRALRAMKQGILDLLDAAPSSG